MEDRLLHIDAKLSALKFLLTQIYANQFLGQPQQLKAFADGMVKMAAFKSHTKQDLDEDTLVTLQAQVVIELQNFFAGVISRVEQDQGRSRQ